MFCVFLRFLTRSSRRRTPQIHPLWHNYLYYVSLVYTDHIAREAYDGTLDHHPDSIIYNLYLSGRYRYVDPETNMAFVFFVWISALSILQYMVLQARFDFHVTLLNGVGCFHLHVLFLYYSMLYHVWRTHLYCIYITVTTSCFVLLVSHCKRSYWIISCKHE